MITLLAWCNEWKDNEEHITRWQAQLHFTAARWANHKTGRALLFSTLFMYSWVLGFAIVATSNV